MFTTANLKPGDRVGVRRRYGVPIIQTVEKKTATGQVTVNGVRYGANGEQIGGGYQPPYLVDAAEADEQIRLRGEALSNNAKVSAFVAAVEEATNRRGGDFPKLSEEVKAKLAAMLAEL